MRKPNITKIGGLAKALQKPHIICLLKVNIAKKVEYIRVPKGEITHAIRQNQFSDDCRAHLTEHDFLWIDQI